MSERPVYRLIHTDQLASIQLGRSVRIRQADLAVYLRTRRRASAPTNEAHDPTDAPARPTLRLVSHRA